MSRFFGLLRFELGFYLSRISTWVYFVALTAVAFLMMLTFGGAFPDASGSISGTDGHVLVNSPFVLMVLISTFGLFGVLVTAAISGNAGYRDFGHKTHPLVFTTPVSKLELLGSRWIGAILINLVVMLGIGLGLWLGTINPWVEADRFGVNRFAHYLRPYLVILIPNLLLTSAIFVSLAAITRKKLPHYLGGAGMLLGYILSSSLLDDLETKAVGALTDPFGIAPMTLTTEYWTTVERNTRMLGLDGFMLWNRLLWVGVALLVFGVGFWRFRFSQHGSEGGRKKKKAVADAPLTAAPAAARIRLPSVTRTFGWRSALTQLWASTTRAFREVVVSPFFFSLLLAGVLFFATQAVQIEKFFGTRTWPLTWKMIDALNESFGLFIFILVTLFAGELVWRERDLKLDQVVDATPVAGWVPFLSKLLALGGMLVFLLAGTLAAGVVAQVFLGYYDFELALYVKKLFGLQLLNFMLLAVLALTIQTLANHKYTAHFVFILFMVALGVMQFWGVEHTMLLYGEDLGSTYSDMNAHGWFLSPYIWFKLYWGGFAVLLAALSNLLWPRGIDSGIRQRIRSATLRFRPAVVALVVLGATMVAGAGGFVYYNTNVLNTYRNSDDTELLQAQYEKEYKQYESLPQPSVTDVSMAVDLYPSRGDARVSGTYRLVNRTEVPIDAVHVQLQPPVEIRKLEFGVPAELDHEDSTLGYRIFKLERPLAPQQTTTLEFDLFYDKRGFAHRVQTDVVGNGTFVNSSTMPSFGYDPGREIALERTRKKHGFAARPRMRDLDDPEGRGHNYISRDAHWVTYEAVVSTDEDQIALSPGYLQREWVEDGRRYFHYKMDAPILHFVSFLSARYEVDRDRWNDEVAIEVYHDPKHRWNVPRMIDGVKRSLDYFSAEFSPYQHRQLRILEFPRYETFAQSFPNTIPYSESIGFIARVGDDDIDYPFYVTAHEVAHQWWAHQVIGGGMQGATVLSETLAQYSALMVMEHEYGAEKMRRFLRYELDNYLRGRTTERDKELPLLRVEDQAYIHYRKGSLVMYALKDVVGEQDVNRALAGFIDTWGFKGPPYPTSRDLLAAFLDATPDEYKDWVREMFERIILYENKAESAVAKSLGGDRYEVTLTFDAKKLNAGELGQESEVALNDPVDIGVFGADDEPLYFERHRLDGSVREITVTVEGKPVSAGIDPYNKLIDRHPEDNETDVEIDKG